MHSNIGHERVTPDPNSPNPTRHNTNHHWCYRGDNTKYRNKK